MTQYGFLDGWSYAIGIRIERINEIISKLLEHNPVEIYQTTIDTSTYKGSFIVNKVYLSIDNETHLLCVQLNINCNIHVETLFEAQDYDLNEKTVNIMTNLSSYTIVQTHNGSTYDFNLNIPNMDNFSITFECDEIDSTITVQLINNVFKQFYNEKVKQNKIHIRTCNINLPIEIISYIPDYAEFSYIKDQDCLVLLFSNNGQPDFHVTRLLDNNMLPSNSDIFIHVNHDMTVGIIAAVVENKLKISMGKQQRYDGNCDLKYNLHEGSVNNIAPGRNIAYTNGNYCHFWNIDNSPSIDYSYIDVYNHRATVYLRLKIKPYCLYNGYVWTTIPFYFKINSQNDKQFIL
ncbi:unnamed protein product [Didymodactylos carnosus]|uniref:Uncharacterized protein n=1 Tax=Didymodactylos carnosus TaxID=1234261 RepID=A0A8S2I399_9BILA|nr:unnamed protein product [Didymodactylos carnosus]CAF3711477.1 unnamed protein product [Didymodactylos carnosus]